MGQVKPGHLPERATLGVEEEFILLDRHTRRPVARSDQVLETGRPFLGAGHLVPAISQSMIETVSRVCVTATELRRELTRLRRGAARAARAHDCAPLASGTSLLGRAGPASEGDPAGVPRVRDHPRYVRITERFGPLVKDQGVCSCHVHVGVPDLATAVAVTNHLRPWLPLFLALTANSPFWHGADTGHASWRVMVWSRWPTAGPPPFLHSAEHYEEVVRSLVTSGAALDPGMLYWYARPSRHVPTVEVRVADVLPTVTQTVAYALLVRAVVARARAAVAAEAPAPRVDQDVLTAACWRAARDGVTGHLLDMFSHSAGAPLASVPAAEQIAEARRLARPHLAPQDRALVDAWLGRLASEGTGADLQRAAHLGTGCLEGVADGLTFAAGPAPHALNGCPPRPRPFAPTEEMT
ncbi:glutamate--cysteine ligase [Streptomyces sp. SID10815]|uniref:glutamate--cysteine ligase n=1 Tax=Streptomyces sp. SID10815 TaxID=2706027 RepID=UPI0013CAC065|nr:YbdK family carboxylate-amine ligase [Streptomyces sp. SID10815]